MQEYYEKRLLNRSLKILTAVFMLVMFAGCAGGNYGTLKFDRDLDNKFVGYQILPDHNYYITGGYGAPAAILAIHDDYQLDNDANLWVPVPDVSSTHMQKWIDGRSDITNLDGMQFSASYILDLEGERIGAWYSYENTSVKFLENNRIKVYTPNPKPIRLEIRRGRGR